MVTAKVVNPFKEVTHAGHYYEPSHVYPAKNFKADPERVEFLSNVHPKYKKIYLADVTIHHEADPLDKNGDGKVTIPEIKAELDKLNIDYKGVTRREDLLALLKQHQKQGD